MVLDFWDARLIIHSFTSLRACIYNGRPFGKLLKMRPCISTQNGVKYSTCLIYLFLVATFYLFSYPSVRIRELELAFGTVY